MMLRYHSRDNIPLVCVDHGDCDGDYDAHACAEVVGCFDPQKGRTRPFFLVQKSDFPFSFSLVGIMILLFPVCKK